MFTSRLEHMRATEPDRQWQDKIPFVNFPVGWKVKIIPPFAGAVVRFQVETLGGVVVSVYLDCYDSLGYVGKPYWEIYPINCEGETERFLMDDWRDMLFAMGRLVMP